MQLDEGGKWRNLNSCNRSFHDLNIILSAFKIASQASFWIYSFDFNTHEQGLTGKFEWGQKNIETMKMVDIIYISLRRHEIWIRMFHLCILSNV